VQRVAAACPDRILVCSPSNAAIADVALRRAHR
jgi:hypothetical protein